jgi:UDP:flavonoid glycosyltransferase YjiC (YdhE family)
MLLLIKKIAPLLGDEISLVVSYGDPSGDPRPQKLDGLTFFEWCPIKDELMASSDLVVARGGHTTVAEVMSRGKAGLFLPIPYHGEQWGNAAKAQKLGFAKALNPLTVTPRVMAASIREVMDDFSYVRSAGRMKEVVRGSDGLANTVTLIREFL